MLLPVLQQLHEHPRVRLLLTSRVLLGADLPAMRLKGLSSEAAAAMVLDSVNSMSTAAYQWEYWQAQKLADLCNHNALLLSIVSRLVACEACTVKVRWRCRCLRRSQSFRRTDANCLSVLLDQFDSWCAFPNHS